MRFDARMNSYMHVESHTLIERFRAARTYIFLLVAVNLQMAAQVAFIVEQLITFWTFGRKLLCSFMHGNVVFIVSQLGKALLLKQNIKHQFDSSYCLLLS